MDENPYDELIRRFGLDEDLRTAATVNGSFRYTPYTVEDTSAPSIGNAAYAYSEWRPIYPLNDSYEDSVKQILTDICDILADLLYKEKLTGDHREDLASIRAFIDSIKVERESNERI